MSLTIFPDFGSDVDTFPVDYEQEEAPINCSTVKPIQLVCPKCGLVVEAKEVTVTINEPIVFDSIENTWAGNYYFDFGKCINCNSELERRYNEVNQ